MRAFGRIAMLALLASAVGCGGDDSEPVKPKSDVVEMFSWWTAGGEKQALDAVLAIYSEGHPDTEIINVALEGGGMMARERLEQRIREKNPPEIFQSNGGLALRNWIDFEGATEPTIQPLDEVFDTSAFPENVLDTVRIDGKVYALPVNIHRTNAIFYNVEVFEANGLEPPTTLAEFYTVGDALLALDTPIIPLAIGSEAPWTLSLLVMENILVAKAGPQYYQDFFTGKGSPDDPEMLATLEEILRIWDGYANEDAADLAWDEAVQMVADGKAAMTIMGDWAKGYLQNAGQTPGTHFMQAPTFDTQGTFVFTGDCFALPVDNDNQAGAEELLNTFASQEAQSVFNQIKGSLPARLDVDLTEYDSQAVTNYEDFTASEVTSVASLAAFVPPAFGDALAAALAEMHDSRDPEVVLEALRDNYALLSDLGQ